eukprot:773598-Pyramimonas_sp.AAC.2
MELTHTPSSRASFGREKATMLGKGAPSGSNTAIDFDRGVIIEGDELSQDLDPHAPGRELHGQKGARREGAPRADALPASERWIRVGPPQPTGHGCGAAWSGRPWLSTQCPSNLPTSPPGGPKHARRLASAKSFPSSSPGPRSCPRILESECVGLQGYL